MARKARNSSSVGFDAQPGDLGRAPIVIVGAGLAGLFAALRLSPIPVTVISPAPLGTGAASAWAQGGIAAAVGEGDTVEAHARDTVTSGAGLVDPDIAKLVAGEAPARVDDLLDLGVPFDQTDNGQFQLSREAAHSAKRIVRVSGDKAGAAIMQTLKKRVRATPSIRVLEGYELEDLIVAGGRVRGVRLVTAGDDGTTHHLSAKASAVLLATGGVGALYKVTTNPAYARGVSLGIAANAGAVISDAEFMQFHPTALDFGLDPAPLATESLRGEGATLVDNNTNGFMAQHHEDGDLAPRDIVARGVFAQNQNGLGAFLDCRAAIGKDFQSRFPTVYASCQRAGFDPVTQPLPVVTAAHYHMGGIATDLRARTSVPGLWAVGEVAATGLHGANRLASNSLLETLVFGARAACDIGALSQWSESASHSRDGMARDDMARDGMARDGMARDDLVLLKTGSTIADDVENARRNRVVQRARGIMSDHVGVIRNANGLRRAARELRKLERAAVGDKLLANMFLAARFIATSALLREESRGAQFRSDFATEPDVPGSRSFFKLSDIDAVNIEGDVFAGSGEHQSETAKQVETDCIAAFPA